MQLENPSGTLNPQLSSQLGHSKISMQPSLPLDSVLRDRYEIKQVIGRGGMGRTYMAMDRERFNEVCVLKEFIPTNQSPEIIDKAKQLFQREASILYQIKHPQVPEFRATFAVDGRLFLVQDYVEGQTYREILKQRSLEGRAFTESEIINLLSQVLPILGYIHNRNIIHRDVSPENLMLRSRDRMPVLIDFGVVKETATKLSRLHLGDLPASTVAGKLGYAPPEQMQSGRAYANSDLYALAVTAIVLLTGKEPQDLFDDASLSWQWQQYVSVNSGLAQILNKMLSYKPSNRYSSSDEVLHALEMNQAAVSEVRTMAVGAPQHRSNAPSSTYAAPTHTVYAEETASHVAARRKRRKSKNKLGAYLLGALVVLLSGVASWGITSLIFNRDRTAEVEPEPVVVEPTPTAEPSPRPTAATKPPVTKVNRNLLLNDGTEPGVKIAAANGKVNSRQAIVYRISGDKGNVLTASLAGSGLVMSLDFEDQDPINSTSNQIELGYWQGELPASGSYFVTIQTVPGVSQSDFNLDLQLTDPEAQAAATLEPEEPELPIPTEAPTPSVTTDPNFKDTDSDPDAVVSDQDVEVPQGTTRQIAGTVNAGEVKEYSFNVDAGRTLVVMMTEGDARIEVYDPNGGFVWPTVPNSNQQQISGTTAGQYTVRVFSDRATDFRINVAIK
ncbi:serine/threonine protein kinase [Thalassoporum mexicanum PCC 7367]|uniref:serine/threonine-protein kinase n=1 Tax=Thalassoporum mexicanum TaxID=3457544 RepID=UPI00029FA60C|nr:serine/threonine-protein kinase [Pseudanabaena sp. PCC 7367]AFY68592.1 serine/threonine protein kinase [Pseudanabaena sp. PCC 7367]